MYKCSKCGKEMAEPKDVSARSARCQCGNMVAFSEAATMVPLTPPTEEVPREDSEEILIYGYRIVRKIGEGGMGSVFEAIQESLGRKVAIKVMPRRLASDPQFVRRFEREAGALSQLRHPNIGGIIDRGSASGTYYFVMEYVADKDGNIVTMHDLISRGKLDKTSVLKFTREIAGALAYAHSKGIVHRDIKPSNVLIDEHSAARVVDFGIAQILGDEQNRQLHLTMTGAAIGTPQYMSPEQRTDMSKSDARSDIYSLGVLVYEMLTGGLPEGSWDLPSQIGCDPKWDAVVENAIRKLPERRFQTMTDFIAALDTIGSGASAPNNAAPAVSKEKEEHYRTPVPSSFILGKCPGCGAENPGDNRFCNGCGASLYEACPACQAEIRVGLRFCGKCGIDMPKLKKTRELQSAIAKALETAATKSEDILAATEILLDAAEYEDSIVNMSATGETQQPLTVRAALNNLWDEKAIATEIFPASGVRHIDFLSRVSSKLPDRKDITEEIRQLVAERDELLNELRSLFKENYFLSLMQAASKSKWGEYHEIASIVSEAEERFAKVNKLIDLKIPELIAMKWYYELNKVLTELERLCSTIDGVSELRKETVSTIDQAKQLYEHAIELNSANKLQEAVTVLEKLLSLCADYPEASILLDKIRTKITECSDNIDEAKKLIARREYRKSKTLLSRLVLVYDTDEVKSLYVTARKEADKIFKRNLRVGIALLSVLLVFIIAFYFNKYLHYKSYSSYCEKASQAFSSNEYDKAIELYNEALKVPGYEKNSIATGGLKEAKEAYERSEIQRQQQSEFDKLLTSGKEYLEKKDWTSAEKSFKSALAIPGYEGNNPAKKGLKEAKEGTQIKRQSENEFNKVYAEALEQYRQIRLLDKDDPSINDKSLITIKIIADFAASDAFSYITDKDQKRLTELKGQIDQYIKGFPLKGQPWTIPHLGMQFVYVEPGNFQMGSDDGDNNEKYVHSVNISKSYWIGKYEVTQDEYQSITGSNPSCFKGGKKPVETVSWNDAVSFCQKLTTQERTAGRLPSGYEYRLPTEAEWEFAARGGTTRKGYKYSGSDNLDRVAWYDPNSGKETHDVGTKTANERGIYDMSGNVWEWCSDWYWYGGYSGDSATDPAGALSGSHRAYRGGGFNYAAMNCRVASRDHNYPGSRSIFLGFRVALALIKSLSSVATNNVKTSLATIPANPTGTSSSASVINQPASQLTRNKDTAEPGVNKCPEQGQPWKAPSLNMQFVYVAPGSFQMGSNDSDSEKPVYKVTISKEYWLGKYEVTQYEYEKIIGSNPSCFKGWKEPVETVSWNDAVSFCQKLTTQERAAGRLPSGYEYRLPTEAEWEFAAKGGAKSQGYKYSGSNDINSVAWYKENSGSATHGVGTKSPNELGICDMSGNVWEWCLDDWHDSYASAPSDGSRGGDGTGPGHVFRGGGWYSYASYCRVAYRYDFLPDGRYSGIGFRVALAFSSK